MKMSKWRAAIRNPHVLGPIVPKTWCVQVHCLVPNLSGLNLRNFVKVYYIHPASNVVNNNFSKVPERSRRKSAGLMITQESGMLKSSSSPNSKTNKLGNTRDGVVSSFIFDKAIVAPDESIANSCRQPPITYLILHLIRFAASQHPLFEIFN